MKSQFNTLAQRFFSSHTSVNEVHITTDGNAFIKKADAAYHNKRNLNTEVHTFTRDEVVAKIEIPVNKEVKKDIRSTAFENLTYAELKATVDELKITVADKKKETLVNALKNHFNKK